MPSCALVLVAACLLAGRPLVAQQAERQPFVIERYHTFLRFEDDGTGRIEMDVRVRLQTEAALQSFGQLAFPYASANQRLDIDTVRVHKAGGGTVLAPPSAVQDVNGPQATEAPMFSDLRFKVVTVPALRPGDTLEYHVSWTTTTALAPGHFWYAADFIRDAIVLDQRLTAVVPRGKYVQVATNGVPAPTVTDSADRRTHAWRWTNLAIDTTATLGARARHRSSAVRITTFRSWDEVGRWYAGLERDRETVTPEIQARADSLVRGRASLEDSIAALYDFVARDFRYVSLSFGLGRYQPHLASEVLANQYGDCKDKHTLLAALLRAIGVVSAPVLISSTAAVDSAVPSPDQFDHLITFVPARRDTFWLDATPGVAPFRLLLSPLRDARALVMPLEGAARLLRTPGDAPFPEFERITVEGRLTEAGTLTATVRHLFRGDNEVVIRQLFRQIPEDRHGLIGSQIARQEALSGVVSAVRASDPRDTREAFALTMQLEWTGALDWKSTNADFWAPLPAMELPAPEDSTAPPDTLALGQGEESRTLRLDLPAGITARLPVPVTLTRDYAAYRSAYRLEGRTLIIERTLRFSHRQLLPAWGPDYSAFRRALRSDEQQAVTFTRPAGSPGVAAGQSAADLFQAAYDAFENRDLRTALRLYRRVVALEPRHQDAWNNLGQVYLDLGQLDSAAAALRRQIELDPYHLYAHNNLGLALQRMGRRDEAASAFRRQIEVTPLDRYAHTNLGRLMLEMRHPSDAVAALTTAASVTPEDASVLVDLGLAYDLARDTVKALAAFDRAVGIDHSPAFLNAIAYRLALNGIGLERAERWARMAIDSTEPVLRDISLDEFGERELRAQASLAAYWDTLGWILFRRGEAAKAEPYVRAAWLLAYRGEIGDHLGQIQERLGRRDEAIRTYALAANAWRPPGETRTRLAALVGGRARADRLVETTHLALQELRTVRLPRALRADATGQVEILFAPGPRIEAVRFGSGPTVLSQAEPAIRAAVFPVAFPDGARVRLAHRGLLTCAAASGACTLVLIAVPMEPYPVRN